MVRQQEDAQNGDIVAAMLDSEATVKTFKRSDGHAWLIPHNPAYTLISGTRPAPRPRGRGTAPGLSDRGPSEIESASLVATGIPARRARLHPIAGRRTCAR